MKQQINGNNPIRVLHMAPISMGGITELVLTLSEKIDFEKVQFDYLTFEDTFDQASKRAKEAHSTIYRVDLQTVKNPIVRGLKKFFGIIKLVHSEQIKIIHINSSTPYEVLVAFAAKIGGAKKIIYHSHNSSYYPGQKLVKLSEVFKWFMPFVITDYLACSDAAARFMFPKKIVDAENYTVIKNGVDYDKHSFKPEVRTELRKKYGLENNFVLGHVGRFNVQKNHEFLIDIFYEVYKHDNSARLFLVGIGETENQIKEKVKRLGIEEVVIFHGLSDEVNRLWNMLDVFVMPSLYEGLPVAGVEAQANGLPLIVSNTITQELKITDAVEYIGLDEKTSKWCEVIERYNGYKRKNTRMEITNAGFNIDDTAIRLERIYLS